MRIQIGLRYAVLVAQDSLFLRMSLSLNSAEISTCRLSLAPCVFSSAPLHLTLICRAFYSI